MWGGDQYRSDQFLLAFSATSWIIALLAMKALITVFFLLILGGAEAQPKTPVRPIASNATPTPTPFPTPTPVTDQITITADSVLNMGMIGQTWTFQNALGMTNTFTIESAPPVAACRDGNNLVIHMTKTDKDTYWLPGADQAEILFLLHQNPDGSWRSTASLINEPLGSTFNGPLVATYDVIDNQPGMPMPYMIAPPDTATGDNFINETRATSIGGDSLTFSCEIPAGFPPTGPKVEDISGRTFTLLKCALRSIPALLLFQISTKALVVMTLRLCSPDLASWRSSL